MDAYLILAETVDDLQALAVYIGKQDGANKATAALAAKHPQARVFNAPIDVVDTYGAKR
jgi:hypothetical protein